MSLATNPVAVTINQIVQQTMENLGVIDTGQPVAAEDANVVNNRLYAKLEELNARDVIYIDIDDIQQEQQNPLADIMAYELYSAFNVVDPAKIQELRTKGGPRGEAEQTLKDTVRLRMPRQTMRVEQFTGPRMWGRYW